MNWIEIIMEEYKSIRTEIIESLKNQQNILSLGITAIGVLIGFGFTNWDKTMLPELIFLLFIPIFCSLILIVWMGEVARMMRAGSFLLELEDRVSGEISSQKLLIWEHWIREKDLHSRKTRQIESNYIAILSMFLGISILCIIIGMLHNAIITKCSYFICVIPVIVFILFFICTYSYLYNTGKRFK